MVIRTVAAPSPASTSSMPILLEARPASNIAAAGPVIPATVAIMVTYRQPGTVLTDLTFTVPLDHASPGGQQIELFGRQVVAAGHQDADRPWLLFLQGGPGFGAPRPTGQDSWLNRALRDYRVLLLDQRGTGRSSPANRHTLAAPGSAPAQAGDPAHC